MSPEIHHDSLAYRASEFRARIHTAEQLVQVFKGASEWLWHAVKHFGNRSEPWWARVFGDAAPLLYSLHDRIPGKTTEEKLRQIDSLQKRCQEKDPQAVLILRVACTAYEKASPVIIGQLRQALERPRYAHFPDSNPLSPREPGPATYLIGEPFTAVMIIRWVDLRTCYVPAGTRGTPADLPRVKSYVFWTCRVRRSGRGWTDGDGKAAYPYTERTMGWQSDPPPAPRRWQFRPPFPGGTK